MSPVSEQIERTRQPVRFATLLALFLATPAAGLTGDPPPPRPLDATTVLEADLVAGETHTYRIDLKAGDYLAVVVDQRGIDVIPAIAGPDGVRIFRNDTGDWGPEDAIIVAEVEGAHRLDVEAPKRTAPRGRYELRVESLRQASPDDLARAGVMRLFSQAYAAMAPDLMATGSVLGGNGAQARKVYEQALGEARRIQDRPKEAFAHSALAFVAGQMDDREAAIEHGRRALGHWQAVGNRYAEARTLRNLALSLRIAGETDQAVSAYEKALEIQRDIGNRRAEFVVVQSLASTHATAGDPAAALTLIYEAIDLSRQLEDSGMEATATEVLARIQRDLGEDDLCLETCRRVLAMPGLDDPTRATVTGIKGMTLARLGDTAGGRAALEESLAYWTKVNWRGFQGNVLMALGDLHVDGGEFDRAREVFDLAVTRMRAAGFVAGETAARRRLAETLIRLGRPREAASALPDVDLAVRDTNPNARALDLVVRAKVSLAESDLAGALGHAEAALGLAESARARASSGRVRTAMLASSQVIYETLVGILMAEHEKRPGAGLAGRALEVSERARARSLLEMILASRRGAPEGSSSTLGRMRSLQSQLNAKAQALDAAQRAGSASLAGKLTREIDELTDRFTILEATLRKETTPEAALVEAEPLTVASIQSQVLDQETLLVEYLLGEEASYAWVVGRKGIRSHRLAPRKVIEEAALAFQKAVSGPPAGGPERREVLDAAEAKLGSLLLGPLEGAVKGQRLLIVAPGVLQQVPFAALRAPDSSKRLIEEHEILHAPSASIVAASRKVNDDASRRERPVVVFADPVFETSDPRVTGASATRREAAGGPGGQPASQGRSRPVFPGSAARAGLSRLPFSLLEAQAIAALAPAGSVHLATGFDASLSAVTAHSLADYRIVHFATHGFLDARRPQLSGLVFSLVDETGSSQDGFLRLHALEQIHLDADLAVLSGCETALGRRVEGEGTIGLMRGFMLAGARGVMASLWRIDDLATAEMMKHFYHGLLVRRLSAPAALREAQTRMAASDRWAHPYYWAGFILQCDWRQSP